MVSEAALLERKIIGVLIRAARERAHHNLKVVAQQLGVSPGRLRQYESGVREVSLPELENLALFCQVPLSYFLNGENPIRQVEANPPSGEALRARRALVATKLRQARLAAQKSPEECAQLLGRTTSQYKRYESGHADVPITELDRIARFLKVGLYHFLQDGALRIGGIGVLDLETLARLPKDIRLFVTDPNSLPYLRMAIKFRDLPTEKLKELGEIFLVVR